MESIQTSLMKRFEEYGNDKLNEFTKDLRKKMEELCQLEITLRFVTVQDDNAVPAVLPTQKTTVHGNEAHQATFQLNLAEVCQDFTIVLPSSWRKSVDESSSGESVMTTIDMGALTSAGSLKRQAGEQLPRIDKRLRKQVWTRQADDEVTGSTTSEKRDYAVKMAASCKTFSEKQVAVTDGRKELVGREDERCYWCLSYADDDDIKPFTNLPLLSTVCCDRWVCRQCLENGVARWKETHRMVNRAIPCLFCRPARKTMNIDTMLPSKTATRAQCGYAAVFWLSIIETAFSSTHSTKLKTAAAWLRSKANVSIWLWEMNESIFPGVLKLDDGDNLYQLIKDIVVENEHEEEEEEDENEDVDSFAATENDEVSRAVQTILPGSSEHDVTDRVSPCTESDENTAVTIASSSDTHDVTDGVSSGVECSGYIAETILPEQDGTEGILSSSENVAEMSKMSTVQVNEQLPPRVDILSSEEFAQILRDLYSSFPFE